MTDSKQPGFWQTLPGVLTALAGLITAVAGLIVAFNQMQARSARASETEQALAAAQAPAASQTAALSRPPSDSLSSVLGRPETVPPVFVPLTVGPPGEVRFKDGSLVFSVLEAKLEPFNQDTRVLNVRLRINNGMKVFDRSYYAELRAIADGLPQAPVDAPLEQIEAHSVKDLTYTFRLPAVVRSLALRITRDEQVGDIPLHRQ
jgi:hypothetical protein